MQFFVLQKKKIMNDFQYISINLSWKYNNKMNNVLFENVRVIKHSLYSTACLTVQPGFKGKNINSYMIS